MRLPNLSYVTASTFRVAAVRFRTPLLFLFIINGISSKILLAQDETQVKSVTIPTTKNAISASDSLLTEALDQVVVTATRTSHKQSQTGKVISVIPSSVVKASGGKSLSQLLQQHSLLYVNGAQGAPGSNQELSLWGGSSGYTLILLDGVPLRDPSQISQAADLNHINSEQIDRIEILKGAQSTLWGSDAVAGVIHILTKSGDSESGEYMTPYLTFARGSFQENRLQTGVTGRVNRLSYGISYGFQETDGISAAKPERNGVNFEKDELTQHRLFFTSTYRFNEALNLQYRSLYSVYETDLDAGAFQDDYDYTAERKLWSHSFSAQYTKNRWNLSLQQSWTRSDRYLLDDSTHVGGFAIWSEGTYKGDAAITDFFGVVSITDAFSWLTGAQLIRQKTAQSYRSLSSFGWFESMPISKDESATTAYSLYSSFLLSKYRWNLEAGFRFNSHSIYDQQTTFTLNPSLRIHDHVRLFFNLSTGYKIPSLYQLYSEYGNFDLTPESSFNLETGFQLSLFNYAFDLRLVGFRREISDMIIFFTDENWVSSYVNRDAQLDHGFEIDTRLELRSFGSWRNSLLYVQGEGESESIKVENLYRRPNLLINSQLFISPQDQWSLQTSFRFVGKRLNGPFDLGPDRMPGYYTIGVYGELKLNSNIRLFVDAQNITDQNFDEVVGYSTLGRRMTAGVSLQF